MEREREKGTHELKRAGGRTSQDMKRRKRASEGHSLPGKCRETSQYSKGKRGRRALTPWREKKEGRVRTRKKESEGHSQTGRGRKRDKSGHGNNSSERVALTSWRAQREKQVITQKESGRAAAGTHELESAEGQVRSSKQNERARERELTS
jgi:hypothetical protein